MILGVATSKNGVLIRLTDERWQHITTSHKEIDPRYSKALINVIKEPDTILKGDVGELLAIQKVSRKKLWIVVAYKEVSKADGFVITAYLTTDSRWLFRREVIWSKQ